MRSTGGRDLVSGSLAVFDAAVGEIRSHVTKFGGRGLGDLLDAVAEGQPSMSLVLNLVHSMRGVLPAGRQVMMGALDGFCTSVTTSRVAVAADFAGLVAENGWVSLATFSRSGQVLECFATAARAGLKKVTISEGRPSCEGVVMAKELRGEGMDVSIVADSALPSQLPASGALVVGSDACFESGFANKVGTAFLMREARAAGLRTVVLSIPEKILGAEVAGTWRNSPAPTPPELKKLARGVRWGGELFEVVPWGLADLVLGGGNGLSR